MKYFQIELPDEFLFLINGPHTLKLVQTNPIFIKIVLRMNQPLINLQQKTLHQFEHHQTKFNY